VRREDDEDDEIPSDSGRFEEVTDEPLQVPVKDDANVRTKEMTSPKKEATSTLHEAAQTTDVNAGEAKKRPLHLETKKEESAAVNVETVSKKAKTAKENKNKNKNTNNNSDIENRSHKDNNQKSNNNRRQLKGGITIEDHTIGKGAIANKGRKVQILYKGKLASNGKQFDANLNRKHPFAFRLGVGDVIKGFDIGVEGMRVGGKRTVHIPSKMGYGAAGAGKTIPPHSDLVFEIELINA
jgi:FK506-binding nuclear protein